MMIEMLFVALAVFVLAIGAAFALAPRASIETVVDIAAPPERVWTVLTETAGHARWNPFIVSMEGRIAEGETLTNVLAPASGARMTFSPTVTRVVPGRELAWLGRLFVPGLFDGLHRFVLEPTETGTRLFHSERFSGVGLYLVDVQAFEADFTRMNLALKAEAER